MDRRRHGCARSAATAAVVALLLAGCGAQGGSEAQVPASAPVEDSAPEAAPTDSSAARSARFAQAARTTAEATTRRFEVTFEATGADGEVRTITTDGAIDLEARRSRSATRAEPAGRLSATDGLISEMVVIDGVVYTRLPGLGDRAADGRWIRADLGAAAEALGFDAGAAPTPEPTEGDPSGADRLLDLLGDLGGDVVEVGTDEVRGVSTRRYAAELTLEGVLASQPDLEGFAAGLDAPRWDVAPIPVDVWIDDEGLVRRVQLVVAAGSGADAIEVRQTVELWDVGEPVEIEVPAEGEVIDVGELIEQFAGGSRPGD